jgi:hypothetical protein
VTERGYLRAVEGAWSKLSGRAVVLSPREFEMVSRWYRRGVPLAIVLEALTHQTGRSAGRGRGVRSLTFAGPAVEAAWDAVAGGRVAKPRAPAVRLGGSDPWASWERAHGATEHEPLRALLGALLERARSGAPAAEIDASLDRELPAAAPPEVARAVEAAAVSSLSRFRDRMPAGEFERTLLRARADGLRERLGLARLTLALGTGDPSRRGGG